MTDLKCSYSQGFWKISIDLAIGFFSRCRKRILENAKGHIEVMLLCMYNCL